MFDPYSQDAIDAGLSDDQLSQLYRPRTRLDGQPVMLADAPPGPGGGQMPPPVAVPPPPPPPTPAAGPTPAPTPGIYRPQYVDIPRGYNALRGVAAADRDGLLGVIASALAGKGEDAMNHNAMERQRYLDSLDEQKVLAETARWSAIAEEQRARARELDSGFGRGLSGDAALVKLAQDPALDPAIRDAIMNKLNRAAGKTATPTADEVPKDLAATAWGNPRHDGESIDDWHQRIYGIRQKELSGLDQSKTHRVELAHPGRGAGQPKVRRSFFDQKGDQWNEFDDGTVAPAQFATDVKPNGPLSSSAPKPNRFNDASQMRSSLLQGLMTKKGKLSQADYDSVDATVAAAFPKTKPGFPELGPSSIPKNASGHPVDQSHVTAQAPPPQAPQPIVQISPSTGMRRVSNDGGQTWQILPPGQ